MNRATKPRQKEFPALQVVDPNLVFGETGVPTPENYYDLAHAYAVHVWVYACVRAIATNVAAVEILPYVKDSKGSWIEDTKHELDPLMGQPNPYMSGHGLREYTAAALKLTGNAYWVLEYLGQKDVQEIWPLLPGAVRPVPSKTKMVDHYVLDVNGKAIPLPYENVIHFREMNPDSFIFGQGGLAAAKNAVATDIFAQIWNKKYFSNSARPEAALETEQTLQPAIRDRVLESWKKMHQGAEKHGKTALLEGGLKYKPISESVKDMDFVNLRKDLRIEILAAFGVPPSAVGLLEFANYSNMEQQDKMFWNNTLLPTIGNIADTLTLRARQISFRTQTIFQGDTSKVQALRPDMKMLAETTASFVNSGVPINQVIDALDLPFEHVEGGDVPRQPTPAGFGNAVPNAPAAPEPAKSVKAIQKEVRPDEALRVGRWKRFDEHVREHEGEFTAAMSGFFKGQKRRILKNLQRNADAILSHKAAAGMETKDIRDAIDLIFDLDNEAQLMAQPAGRLIKGAYFDFFIRTAGQIKPSFDPSLQDPFALQWIKDKTFRLVRNANQYTKERISVAVVDAVQEAVAAGFENSETIDQIRDRIDDVFKFAVETRAERIARTEVISASNAGSFEAMKKTGVERKEWLSSRDEKVRETHQELDGQEQPIDQPFISSEGAALMYPGDPNGPASEIVQCRCTPVAVTKS
jgi:HK97 family phage portal protein